MNIDNLIIEKYKEYFIIDSQDTREYFTIMVNALRRQQGFQHIIDNQSSHAVNKESKEYFDHYIEVHHIIPRSVDPLLEDYKPNLVVLTAQEHFRCHRLLVDMCNMEHHRKKMAMAFHLMCQKNKGKDRVVTITEEEYALARELKSKLTSDANRIHKPKAVECYIIVDGEEIVLDRFDSRQEASDKTNGTRTKIIEAVSGKVNYSGTYNIENKQYNEIKFKGPPILPNNNYPTTYKMYWRKPL